MNKKIAFVTGGSRGIGRAIVLQLVRDGFFVIFTYQTNEQLARRVEQEATNINGVAKAYSLNIQERDSVRQLVNSIEKEWGYIDVLVNNAGIIRDRTFIMMREEEWNEVMQVNLYGPFYLTQRVLVSMMKRKMGRIINISSISAITGMPGQVNYSSSKAGLIGLTRSLAKEVAEYGITVNCVAPAGILTDMITNIKENVRKDLEMMTPMKRLGTPDEVARVVSFLANSFLCPDYLNGAIIPIDGGMGVV